MKKYQINSNEDVVHEREENVFFSLLEWSPYRTKYYEWLAEGNIPDPPDPPYIPDPDELMETYKVIKKLRKLIQELNKMFPELDINTDFDEIPKTPGVHPQETEKEIK